MRDVKMQSPIGKMSQASEATTSPTSILEDGVAGVAGDFDPGYDFDVGRERFGP